MNPSLSDLLAREKAAIFFSASWSGPSNVALRALQAAADEQGMTVTEFHIVDVDVEEKAIHQLMAEGYSMHGYGEAAVVRNGKISFFSVLGRDPKMLPTRVREFLARARA
jgi:hypothetical protein